MGMIKVGITGQNGFIGSSIFNRLSLNKSLFEIIPFSRDFFSDKDLLSNWVSKCNVIIHLAGLNRHSDQEFLYNENIRITKMLIQALRDSKSTPHVIFSSSLQEDRDNLYGNSKKICRKELEKWAEKSGGVFTGLIIPNVFGPFGQPYYNSVVATFCHQLCNEESPSIDVDGNLKLIYIDELVNTIISIINNNESDAYRYVEHSKEIKVSKILEILVSYKEKYLQKGVIPELSDNFELNLFNSFRSYLNYAKVFPRDYIKNIDDRGMFVELLRLESSGQISFSTTKPNITRGNHFHTRKIERFMVIKGRARIELRKYNTTEKLLFELGDNSPGYVDMPIWYTHNITNIGDEELITVFWINEFFNPDDTDTYFEIV